MKIDRTTLFFVALAAVLGALTYLLRGSGVFVGALGHAVSLFLTILPQFAAGILIAGLIQQVIDQKRTASMLGSISGMRSLVLATVAGMATPGGPFMSFPLVYALWVAGADVGTLVAYISAWTMLSVHRVLVWDIPFLGVGYSILRFLLCLPLPLIAGLLAREIVARTGLDIKPRAPTS